MQGIQRIKQTRSLPHGTWDLWGHINKQLQVNEYMGSDRDKCYDKNEMGYSGGGVRVQGRIDSDGRWG